MKTSELIAQLANSLVNNGDKERIAHMGNPVEDSGCYSEADYQTWLRV